MASFDPQKLSVTFLPPADSSQPLRGRKYTLTHSDITAELFLDVGYMFNKKAIDTKMRDEVLAEWTMDAWCRFYLIGQAYVDGGEYSKKQAEVRFTIFNKEMTTALKGMIYGDRTFFSFYPFLLDAPIFISFQSMFPEFRQATYFGTPRKYVNETLLE
ncbi:staygreen family protein [Halobacillus mangrovi]|uniref:staygreen family protein n=1 Tax=Halobacillus mangrovi TaxID=402384 RepID=UPI003D970F43